MYSISLQTSKPVVTADDIIGIVNFAASNEEDLRDSIFVGATISAIAEGPFTQVSNPTSLVFTTSDSGPANEQVRITSVGNVGIGNPSPQYKLDVKGELNLLPYNTDHTIRLGRGSGKASIIAEGTEPKDQWLIMDSNGSSCALNYFSSNDVQLAYGGGGVSVGTTNPGSHKFRVAGGTTAIDGGHFTFNDNGGNFDFRVEGDTDPNLVFADASTDNVGIGLNTPETKLDVQVSAMLDGIRVSGPLLPSVQIISTGDSSSHAIIGNNQGQLTIAADMTSVGGVNSVLQLGVKGETVLKITDAKAEVVDGTLAANTVNLGPSTTRHFSISRDTSGTFGNAIIQDILGDIKLIAGSAVAIKIMNDSAGGTGGVRFYDEYTLPLTDGDNGQVLKTDGNGNVTWQIDNSSTGGGGTVAGTGTAGYNARWTNATTLTDGIIQDNGSQVSVKTAITGRALTVGGTTNSNSAILIQGSGIPAGDGSRGFLVSSYGNGDAYLWNFESRPMIFATSNAEAMRIGSDGSLNHSGGTSATIGGQSAYHIDVTSSETTIGGGRLQVKSGETVINEGGENVDFKVHGDTKLNMIYVDASADRVAIATSTPTETLTVNGGLENLYGWKIYSGTTSTAGQGPAGGFVLKLNDQYGTVLAKSYHYIVRLTTGSTGTRSGSSFLVWWNTAPEEWVVRPIGQSSDVSNHPTLQVENNGTNDFIRVFTDNASPYPIAHTVESFSNGELDARPHSLGADYHWQRYVNDLYYDDGNVGIGIKVPALQSAGKGLHINSDGLHSEIKLTNTVTGEGAGDGVALVATNSSFTINNRSAGEVNINTNNLNAISINSAREVDIKQLLKVRLSNSVGTAGSINRISYYDDGTNAAGIGLSSGNLNYVATAGITQSFYTGGIRSLRLDPAGKVVMGASSNVVAGDASLNYNVGICTNAATNAAIQVLKVAPATGLNTFFNQYNRLTVPSGDITAVRGVYQDTIVENGADLANIYGFTTGTNTVVAGGNVDTVIGYYVNNAFFRGSASNYGIYSDVNSDVTYPTPENKWGLFLAGTAPNYYRGGLKTSILEGRHGSDNLCERVAGGYKAIGNLTINPGYLKIRLPEYLPTQKAGSTMITFDVSVYEYKTGGYKNFHFGGYVYWNTGEGVSQWINTTATMEVDRDIDNAAPWIVRFATDEDDYPCVLVGKSGQDEATNWSYGQIYIQNVRTGFGRTSWDQWSQNWEISLETRSTTDGGYYEVGSSFINKPIMHNQLDYSITAGSYDISSTVVNKIIINQNNTVFNENGVNTDFRVESDANQHMLFVDASSDVVGIGLSNPRTDAILHVGGPSSQNPTLMIGTGGNVSNSICSLKFQDRGPAADQGADGQITGYVQVERDGNGQNFDMTFGTVNTTAGDAVERMRIDKDGFVGIGTSTPTNLLNVSAVGKGSGTHSLFTGDDDSYMSVQNANTGDFLKLGGVYTTNTYLGLSHSDINNSGYMIMSNGVHTFLSCNDSGRVYIRGGKNDGNKGEVRVGDGLVQVNPSSLNVDFIVYGDSVSQLLRTDASKDSVLIGNSTDGGVNSRLYVYDDGAAKVNVTNSRTLMVQGRAYTTLSGTHYHIGALTRAEKWMSGGATDTGYVIGLNAVPVVYSDSAGGQNTLSEITALRANMSINSSLADGINVTNAYDIKCIPSLAGTNSTVTNHFGLYLTSATNGATTVTNAYGVYQADASASNIFAGNMTIGSDVQPDSFDGLTVYGNLSTKRTDGKVMAKDAEVVNKLQASVGAGGGIVGTESNHNLLIRSNNADVARFDVDGNFQVRKGKSGFSPQSDAGTDLYGGLYVQAPDMIQSYCARFKGYPLTGAGYSVNQVNDLRIEPNSSGMTIKFSSNPTLNDPTLAMRNGFTFNSDNIQFNNYSGFRSTPVETFKINTDTGALTINQSYTLPTADGTNGQVLTTDGSGQVSWAAGGGSGGGSAAGTGAITAARLSNWMGVPTNPINVTFSSNTSANPAYVPMGPKVYWATPKFSLTDDQTLYVFDAGVYTIDVKIGWINNGVGRATASAAIEVNDEVIWGTADYSYARGTSLGDRGVLTLTLTEVLSANDKVKVAIWLYQADGGETVETETTSTTIVKIADSISPS